MFTSALNTHATSHSSMPHTLQCITSPAADATALSCLMRAVLFRVQVEWQDLKLDRLVGFGSYGKVGWDE